jgi:hypothetical protein
MIREIRPGSLKIVRIHSSPDFSISPEAWKLPSQSKNSEERKLMIKTLKFLQTRMELERQLRLTDMI